jgi:hypothetical protein
VALKPTLRTSIIRIVAAAFPALVYGYPRTYVVAAVRADNRLDLVPPTDAAYLPELDAVEQWSLGGTQLEPTVGASVCVVFRDANAARPIVVHWNSAEVPDLTLIAGGGDAVARVGDKAGRLAFDAAVPLLYYSPGVFGVPYLPVAATVGPPLSTLPGTDIVLTTGSSKVEAG